MSFMPRGLGGARSQLVLNHTLRLSRQRPRWGPRVAGAFVAACCAGSTVGSIRALVSAAKPQQLEIWSFNLRTEFREAEDGPDGWSKRREGVAQLLRKRTPALVCVQEATEEMLQFLTEHSGKDSYGWAAQSRSPGQPDETAGFLFDRRRLSLLSHNCTWLAPDETPHGKRAWDAECPRTFETATFGLRSELSGALASTPFLRVLNTHFDHVGVEARRLSGQMLASAVAQGAIDFPQTAQLVCGDFNSPKGGGNVVYELLTGSGVRDALRVVPVRNMVASTIHKFKGTDFASSRGDGTVELQVARGEEDVKQLDARHIDWMLWRDAAGEGEGARLLPRTCEVIVDQLPDGRWPSDHFPLSVTFDVSVGSSR
mmetsp:Transcript_26910/g.75816  ORF Transcript_26910/g.75816 Transcript_26910/m.75816 type:complete len:371 (-) Transcript_26910:109-1221(-)